MSERKRIPYAFIKEYGPRIPILAAGLYALNLFHEAQYVAGCVGIGLCVAAGFWVERIQASLRCPDCGMKTERYKPSKEPCAPIEFLCRTCHVIWDTGRRNSSGPSDDD